ARGRIDGSLLDQLERRTAELEAENASLRPRIVGLEGELHDLAKDLQAARAMNRALMAELNRAPTSEAAARRRRQPVNR
ncbi:MAG: hypothetical protein M0Z46_12575, partial [Actinomycetota bacterium]|nr:hypothetical protein [Actinomycetota bacterium]